MVENKNGIIVNISSGWGRLAAAQIAPYCASKWVVEGLTKAVAKELPAGMSCVALNPGVINTEMLQSCFGSSADLYPMPDLWAPRAANLILHLTTADNGASLTVGDAGKDHACAYYFLLPWTCLCMGIFLVKTMKRILFAEVRSLRFEQATIICFSSSPWPNSHWLIWLSEPLVLIGFFR
ncbi:NADPH-dependent pterin aldehyde reductase [Phtheirospermum japonicum]|uniref:NADPH-dependent pterin aldehyde reductase n=1 Tax=Phtheirospermum japonicum TaxID=374723 RepID=A0A830BKZ7_9LAMI|nr:NADPH-dependent pterin aldehyde reductase [Phtheirospermum japonicum]